MSFKHKKSFGQHFLVNDGIAKDIVEALQASESTMVLELGPGQGVLTRFLVNEYKNLKLVELDTRLIADLKKNFPQVKEVVHADFLKCDLEKIVEEKSIAIIGNFPYNISSQIIFKIIEKRALVEKSVGMFQKEVAKRIVSPPGNKDYGILSVLTQAYYSTEYLFDVGKEQFDPPPKVESGVIRITRKQKQTLDCDEKLFKRVVKDAFAMRRKKLSNALKKYAVEWNDEIKNTFMDKRAEQLSVEDYIKITNAITDYAQI